MRQQINLYALLPGQNKFQISLEKLIVGYCIFVFFLIVMTLFDFHAEHKKSVQLNILQTQLAKEKKQINTLIAQYPMLNSKDFEMSMQKLQQELDIKYKMVNLLAQGNGFSLALKDLAIAAVPGAWLTQIVISTKEMQIELKGQALQPTPVHEFLNKLVQQPAFVNTPLELRELVNANTGNNSYLSFYISTKALKQ